MSPEPALPRRDWEKCERPASLKNFRKEGCQQTKSEVRREFYERNGYIKTTDEHGFTIWMTEDEINIQNRQRKCAQSVYQT